MSNKSIVKNKQNNYYRWQVISDLMPIRGTVRGVELGVWKGECAKHLLELMPNLYLYLVDRWEPVGFNDPYYESGDSKAVTTQRHHDKALEMAKEVEFTHWTRSLIIRGDSLEVAKSFHDQLDFVFIDANHTEAAVFADINAWGVHVKPGGIICGHDWGKYGVAEGVKRALGSFINITHDSVWWYRKSQETIDESNCTSTN